MLARSALATLCALLVGCAVGPRGEHVSGPTLAPGATGEALAAPRTSAVPESSPATSAGAPEQSAELQPGSSAEFLFRPGEHVVRVMTWNVHWDSIFPRDDPLNHDLRTFDRQAAFARILHAIRPDVLCLQEINARRSAGSLGRFLAEVASTPPWHVATARDTVIASVFELKTAGYAMESQGASGSLGQAAALVDLPDSEHTVDLYVICAHLKSGTAAEDIQLRAGQADAIMAHVRDFSSPGGDIDLEPRTPFVILGDFNVYADQPAEHLDTLRQGDIHNELRYGLDLRPDWDASGLADASPSHNAQGVEFYTWRDDSQRFGPGTLDRILYSDSVLLLRHAFVLNTVLLSDASLQASGLRHADVLLMEDPGLYDHLPLVADFRPSPGP